MTPRGAWPVVVAIAARPHLWVIGMRQMRSLVAPGWWHRRPWLPVPDPDYLRFRLVTQYGDAGHEPDPSDVVAYLEWCRGNREHLR